MTTCSRTERKLALLMECLSSRTCFLLLDLVDLGTLLWTHTQYTRVISDYSLSLWMPFVLLKYC